MGTNFYYMPEKTNGYGLRVDQRSPYPFPVRTF
jgi:hypothetical protein